MSNWNKTIQELQGLSTTPSTEIEEGAPCRMLECPGHYKFKTAGECTCYISPPCPSCLDAYLACDVCGDAEEYPK